MTERAFVGFDFLAFLPPAVKGLFLTIPPARSDQLCSFVAGQPSVAWRPLGRQRHSHHAMVQVLLGVVIDCSTKRLEVATSRIAAQIALLASCWRNTAAVSVVPAPLIRQSLCAAHHQGEVRRTFLIASMRPKPSQRPLTIDRIHHSFALLVGHLFSGFRENGRGAQTGTITKMTKREAEPTYLRSIFLWLQEYWIG